MHISQCRGHQFLKTLMWRTALATAWKVVCLHSSLSEADFREILRILSEAGWRRRGKINSIYEQLKSSKDIYIKLVIHTKPIKTLEMAFNPPHLRHFCTPTAVQPSSAIKSQTKCKAASTLPMLNPFFDINPRSEFREAWDYLW